MNSFGIRTIKYNSIIPFVLACDFHSTPDLVVFNVERI